MSGVVADTWSNREDARRPWIRREQTPRKNGATEIKWYETQLMTGSVKLIKQRVDTHLKVQHQRPILFSELVHVHSRREARCTFRPFTSNIEVNGCTRTFPEACVCKIALAAAERVHNKGGKG